MEMVGIHFKWDAKERELIEGEIAHWKRMRDEKTINGEAPRWMHSPLCKTYIRADGPMNVHCTHCPIYVQTGAMECTQTPKTAALMAYYCRDSIDSVDFKLAAQKYIDFLEGLKNIR